MDDSLDPERSIIAALRLTAGPPRAWIDAAGLLPATLGELARIEAITGEPEFRRRFAADPAAALAGAGLPSSGPLVAALRDRLAG